MVIVTGRDYRANLNKYYGLARKGEDVVVKARYGSWRVVPITDAEVINKKDLSEDFRGALREAMASMKGERKLNTLDNLIHELRDSDQ